MVPGAPVMTGHDYRLRPDARFFAAKTVRIEDPAMPDRLPVFYRLASAQWTLDEIASGDPFLPLEALGMEMAA